MLQSCFCSLSFSEIHILFPPQLMRFHRPFYLLAFPVCCCFKVNGGTLTERKHLWTYIAPPAAHRWSRAGQCRCQPCSGRGRRERESRHGWSAPPIRRAECPLPSPPPPRPAEGRLMAEGKGGRGWSRGNEH